MYALSLRNLVKGFLINQALKAPEFLKDDLPTGASSTNKFVQAVGRRVCDKYARSPEVDQVIFSPAYGWLCDPYLNSKGQGPTQPGSATDALPGQCSGVLYQVNLFSQVFNDQNIQISSQQNTSYNFLGPLKISSFPAYTLFDRTYSGNTSIRSANHPINNYIDINALVTGNPNGNWVSTSYSISRSDNQPDCITPPNYTPPKYPILPPLPPPTVIPPGNNAPNWDVSINPDGSIKFCVAGICGDLSAPSPSGPPNNPSEDPGTPNGDPTPSDPETGEAKGCVGDNKILTGIQITFTQTPPVSTTLSGQFYKAPIWAGFGPNEDLIDFVQDGAWIRDKQLIIPDSEFCKCFYVKFKKGFKGTVQAFTRPKEDQKK